ncbi:RNA pyrophosphohydrolase [Candidatus Bilamarchaeum dharawalense]|uniref:Bis(5'-nucleosyl)-tetraphosphatase [asymmetrical] n=1 Tax=Candidatus Bilamarchaeum dharawalense TaxID=2885759 RepID=A0A5E4LV20_9ARCH|nr:RNA pyrophosphohydrolase [Candidatus Bilamarchaeum dharawalense]
MIHEKSCGIVVYRAAGEQRLYLLLHYEEGHWDFTKGHVEKNESESQTALREAQEETGLEDLELRSNFHEHLEYKYVRNNQKCHKDVFFFIGKTKTENIQLSDEHIGYLWLPYAKARERLTFENAKEILDKADQFLSNKRK